MTRKLTLLLLLALAASTPLLAETARYMVVTRRPVHSTRLALIANSTDFAEHRVRTFKHAGSFAADLTQDEAAELRLSTDVESVQPVIQIRASEIRAAKSPAAVTHNAPFTQQVVPWGINAIHATDVWPVTRGASINVAVIDTGIDATHPDLVHAYRGGYNDFFHDKAPLDDHGHGTHVAGIIAAADNAFGVVGVAPGASLWAVKVLAFDGYGTDENLVAGLDWVIAKKAEIGGAWVANMSVGAEAGTDAEARGIQRALDAGVIVVAASGNDGEGQLDYPAAYSGVISVGAVDSALNVASFSTYGSSLSIVGPGVAIPSSVARGRLTAAEVEGPSEVLRAYPITGSPFASFRASFINCGYGRPEEFPPTVIGRIAVIERGPRGPDAIPFRDKAKNAKDAGAIAVIIYNDDDVTRPDYEKWTLLSVPEWPDYQFPLTVAMSHVNGAKLLSNPMAITLSYRMEEYTTLNGTSMATPHVSGTVALVLALAPDMNPAEMAWVLEHTTTDVNLTGWDQRSAWGLVNALAAAKQVAPAAFSEPGPPVTPPASSRRRSVRP